MSAMRLVILSALAALLLAGCGSSAVDTAGAPRGAAPAAVVPADTGLFIGVVTESDSAEWKSLEALLGRFPDGDRLLSQIATAVAGKDADWEDDVRPALGPVTALVALPNSGDAVAITKPSLRAKLDALLGRADRPIASKTLEDGWVAVAEKQATLDAYEHALDGPRLADDKGFAAAVDDLPGDSLATLFVRPSGLNLSGLAPATGAVLPSASAGGFEWLGAALTAKDDGLALDGTVRMDKAPVSYEPTLLRQVPAGVVLAVSFHGSEEATRAVTGSSLAPFFGGFESALGVRLQDLLELLQGQGVLYVRPGLPIPEVTLAVEVEDGDVAMGLLDRVAGKLGGSFERTQTDGVPAHVLTMDQVRVSWAVDDGTLIVSTGATAIRDLRSADTKLVDEDAFDRTGQTVGLGDRTAGFVYVDVVRATELVRGLASLAGEELPPELARNLAPIESFVANASTDGDGVSFRGFLSVPAR